MDIVYHFAGKTFIPARNLLIEGNTEQVLEQRVSDLLLAFCQQPNQELSKNELITLVWPDRVVNEDSLSVAISKLRKALGDNRHNPAYIKTLSGRGYLGWQRLTVTTTARSLPHQLRRRRQRWIPRPPRDACANLYGRG